jgi:hypothetical protein
MEQLFTALADIQTGLQNLLGDFLGRSAPQPTG